MAVESGARVSDDRAVGQLVKDASEQMSRLVRDEMRLATEELKQKGSRVGAGAGLMGAAGVSALYGGGALVACVVLALALVLPAWLAALLVGVALLLVAGVLALMGRQRVKEAGPAVPEQAVRNVKKDVETVKEGFRQ